jgi:hypothetical protein
MLEPPTLKDPMLKDGSFQPYQNIHHGWLGVDEVGCSVEVGVGDGLLENPLPLEPPLPPSDPDPSAAVGEGLVDVSDASTVKLYNVPVFAVKV